MRPLILFVLLLLFLGCDGTTAQEYVSRAQSSFDRAEYQTAIIELKNALQVNPELADARLLLARAHEVQGQYPDAVREYERALDLGAQSDLVETGLLRSKLHIGRYQEVIGALAQRERLNPELSVILGDAFLASNDLSRAEELYALAEGTAGAARGLGTTAWLRGDQETAAQLMAEAVRLDAQDRDSWIRQGELALAQGKLTDAERSFSVVESLPGGRLSGLLGLARTYLAGGRTEESLQATRQVLELAPSFFLAHYLEALALYADEDISGAEEALRKVQSVAPEHMPSLYLMGAVKYRQGQLNQAEVNLERFVARDKENESAAKLLAAVRVQKGNNAGAISVLLPFADRSEDPQLLAILGTAQLGEGDASAATISLERAVALAPDDAAFRNQLALSLINSGEDDRAETQLASAVSIDGSQFQSDYLNALLNLKRRDYQAALLAAERMMEKRPSEPMGANLQGAALLALGKEMEARVAFEKALEISPDFLPAARNIARMDMEEGNVEGAIERFESVVTFDEENDSARRMLADLAARTGRPDIARVQLLAVLSRNPESTRDRLALARLALQEQQLDEARRLVGEVLLSEPGSIEALLLSGNIAVLSRDTKSARSLARRLTRELQGKGASRTTLLAAARLQRQTGLLGDAEQSLRLSSQQSGTDLSESEDVDILTETILLAIAQQDAATARSALDRLEVAARSEQASENLKPRVLELEGRTDEAIVGYESLARSGDRNSLLRVVALSQKEGDLDGALELLDEWLADEPLDESVQFVRANLLLKVDKDLAVSQYEALADTNDPVVLNNLAWLYMEKGDGRALSTAEQALKAAPDSADIADTLGWILVQTGRAAEAIPLLERSIAAKPDDATVRYHLGVAYLETERMEAGRRVLQEALNLGAFAERDDAIARLEAL